MNTFKPRIYTLSIVLLVIMVGCENKKLSDLPNDEIPSNLTGVWTTENPEFEGQLLLNGYGVYLDSDGTGVVLAAEPAVGWAINTKYESSDQAILYESTITDEGISGKMKYDSKKKTLSISINKEDILLTRQFEKLDSRLFKELKGEE